MSKSEIYNQVYDLVTQIPIGKVATYGDIAKVVGINPRYVGYILHNNPDPGRTPCHRVVNSQGKLAGNFAFGGGDAQKKLLIAENVTFHNHHLELSRYRHAF